MKAKQVLTADYSWTDKPLQVDDIDGLREAVERVRETKDKELVRCEDRVADYDVYWNSTTEAVRIGAVVMEASYEVSQEKDLSDYE